MPSDLAVFYFFTDASPDEGKIIKNCDTSTVNVVLCIQGGLFKKIQLKIRQNDSEAQISPVFSRLPVCIFYWSEGDSLWSCRDYPTLVMGSQEKHQQPSLPPPTPGGHGKG